MAGVRRARVGDDTLGQLRQEAKAALSRAYARYSGFVVVAAVERTDGEVFGGANVEVANYSLTKHAEEAAVMNAIAARAPLDGGPWLRTIYVLGGAPCGSCRQFLWEFAIPDAVVVIDESWGVTDSISYLSDLLPKPFGPADLRVDKRRRNAPKGLRFPRKRNSAPGA
jgi:cytidine deaminase